MTSQETLYYVSNSKWIHISVTYMKKCTPETRLSEPRFSEFRFSEFRFSEILNLMHKP